MVTLYVPAAIELAGAIAVKTRAGSIVPLTVLYWVSAMVGSAGKLIWKLFSRLTYSCQPWADAAPARNRATSAGIRRTERMGFLPIFRAECHSVRLDASLGMAAGVSKA